MGLKEINGRPVIVYDGASLYRDNRLLCGVRHLLLPCAPRPEYCGRQSERRPLSACDHTVCSELGSRPTCVLRVALLSPSFGPDPFTLTRAHHFITFLQKFQPGAMRRSSVRFPVTQDLFREAESVSQTAESCAGLGGSGEGTADVNSAAERPTNPPGGCLGAGGS